MSAKSAANDRELETIRKISAGYEDELSQLRADLQAAQHWAKTWKHQARLERTISELQSTDMETKMMAWREMKTRFEQRIAALEADLHRFAEVIPHDMEMASLVLDSFAAHAPAPQPDEAQK